jgi:sugar transferase (PEP-CTERM system associated)
MLDCLCLPVSSQSGQASLLGSKRGLAHKAKMARIGSHQVPTRTLLLIGVDAGATVLALVLATVVRSHEEFARSIGDVMFWCKAGLVTLISGLSLYFNDLYDFAVVRRRANLLIHMMQAVGTTCLALALIYYLAPDSALGRGVALLAAPLILSLLLSWRLSADATGLLAKGNERVLVLGTGDTGITLVRHIIEHPEYNLNVVGFLDERGENIGKSLVNPRIIGAATDLQEIVARENVGRVILSMRERRGGTPLRELLNLKLAGVNVEDVHSCFERLSGRIKLEHLSPSWLILSDGFKKSRFSLAVKRVVDFAASSILLILVSPVVPIVILAIYLETGRPIFFRQTRVGYKGRQFELIKFRSMVQDAEQHGPQWAAKEDSRVTRVGRILRKMRLDEVPQLFNVFRGEMSLVGPRPERPVFCQVLEEQIPFFNLRHTIRPGLTGWAQVRFRYGASIADAKGKLELDLFYLKNLSFFVDCAILFETIKVVVLGRGAH